MLSPEIVLWWKLKSAAKVVRPKQLAATLMRRNEFMYYLKQGNVITLVREEDLKYESDTNNNSSKTSLNMDSIMKGLFAIKNTLEDTSEAYKYDKITLEDYNEMLSVIQNLNDYFIDNNNYYEGLSKEVETMFKSFYDPEVEKRAATKEKENIARNLLSDGLSWERVAKNTGLPIERVKEIAKEIMN